VALIAHELGHFASDDPNKGIIIGRSLEILAFWTSTFRQDAQDIAIGLIGIFANVILYGLALLPASLRAVVLRITYDDS
jgi:Zn-dependent protease with chaperone function